MSEQGKSEIGLRPYAYRDASGKLIGKPLPGQIIPPPLEPSTDTVVKSLQKLQKHLDSELTIDDHFDAIIAKLPIDDISEEKQRLITIARDDLENVRRMVNKALTYNS